MSKIVLAVPNFCEGRNAQLIDEVTARLRQVTGLIILDVSRDSDRNRTVFAFTGDKETIFAGGMVLYEEALKRIDMRRHQGNYPRIGALDVFPFVPLKDTSIEEAVALSREFAEKVAQTFALPVYLFSESARVPQRRELEYIREGEYENLEKRIQEPDFQPDFGPAAFRPECGATIIGARYPLISFKVLLTTFDLDCVRLIAQAVQQCGGGLRHVKAIPGADFENKGSYLTVTISNYRTTPMYRVIEMIRMEAKRYGLEIAEVEMIGLIPEVAFIESAMYYMGIHRFDFDRLVERNLQQHLDEKLFLE